MPAVTLSSVPAARPAARPPVFRVWVRRIHTRRLLASLHPDQLRDAGLEPWQVRAEIRKPFWRA